MMVNSYYKNKLNKLNKLNNNNNYMFQGTYASGIQSILIKSFISEISVSKL